MPPTNTNGKIELTAQEYMDERVEHKISTYHKLGDRYRWIYNISSFTSIVSAALVPVLIQGDGAGYKIYATILSLVVTILVSLEKLFHFRSHWKNYDSIEAYLRREQLLYQRKAGTYKELASKEADLEFVERIEEGIKNEREETIEMRTKEFVIKR